MVYIANECIATLRDKIFILIYGHFLYILCSMFARIAVFHRYECVLIELNRIFLSVYGEQQRDGKWCAARG